MEIVPTHQWALGNKVYYLQDNENASEEQKKGYYKCCHQSKNIMLDEHTVLYLMKLPCNSQSRGITALKCAFLLSRAHFSILLCAWDRLGLLSQCVVIWMNCDSEFLFTFLLNNQPDTLIIHIYSVIKLHVSGIFSAHHQEFSTAHSALVSFMKVLMTASKQSQDGTKSLHVLGIFSAHHQEFSTVHSALVSFMKVLMTTSK